MNSNAPMSGMPDLRARDRKRLVLIVEDEYVNRELLKAYLENDYDLLFAETGSEALEIIRARSETLSLVLLDLNLPDLQGMEILRRMFRGRPITPARLWWVTNNGVLVDAIAREEARHE